MTKFDINTAVKAFVAVTLITAGYVVGNDALKQIGKKVMKLG